jgi:hypothetical protein
LNEIVSQIVRAFQAMGNQYLQAKSESKIGIEEIREAIIN